jgi:hypothetical protein
MGELQKVDAEIRLSKDFIKKELLQSNISGGANQSSGTA